MTEDGFTLDDPDTDDERAPGAYLRISRDATADILPDKTPEERAEWLRRLRENEGAEVTLTVVLDRPVSSVLAWGSEVPVREITGLIIGPPGSERFLRRPGEQPTCGYYGQPGPHPFEPAEPAEPCCLRGCNKCL